MNDAVRERFGRACDALQDAMRELAEAAIARAKAEGGPVVESSEEWHFGAHAALMVAMHHTVRAIKENHEGPEELVQLVQCALRDSTMSVKVQDEGALAAEEVS